MIELTNRKPVIHETTVSWRTATVASGLEVPLDILLKGFKDGRTANPLLALWLGQHGFHRKNDETQDPKSGIMEKEGDGLPYRLRCGQDEIHLSPSKNRGMNRFYTEAEMLEELADIRGFLLVFTQDMPDAPIWSVAKEQLVKWVAPAPSKKLPKEDRKKYLLNSKWDGNSEKVRAEILRIWEESGRPAEEPARQRVANIADLLSVEAHGLMERLVKAMKSAKNDKVRQALAHVQQAWLALRSAAKPDQEHEPTNQRR